MSKPLSESSGSMFKNAFRIDGKNIEIHVFLFGWNTYQFLNIKSGRRADRLVWDMLTHTSINLYQQGRSGGSVLTSPPEYIWETVKVSPKYPKGIRRVRKRIDVDGCGMCAIKLSTLAFGPNNMSLPISPDELRALVAEAMRSGNCAMGPDRVRVCLVRTNDLRREQLALKSDRWQVMGGNPDYKPIFDMLPDIDAMERAAGSQWVRAPADPNMDRIIAQMVSNQRK